MRRQPWSSPTSLGRIGRVHRQALHVSFPSFPGNAVHVLLLRGRLLTDDFFFFFAVVVELTCSSAAPCPNMFFENFNVTVPSDAPPVLSCSNVINEEGLPGGTYPL